ncbi:sigma-70 family RNA polymerase sigma factor [Candidatus Parcubacteria bacterium]|nr:MAG: sigma-70 family RNA polymerase sigma factor [Candidatus Parcubacteria bacterium]
MMANRSDNHGGAIANFDFPPPLSKEEEQRILTKRKRSREDNEKLVLHNLRLVFVITMAYVHPNDRHFPDSFQWGVVGLMEAARRWDPNQRACKFSTYASHWVRKYVIEAFYQSDCNLLNVSRASYYRARKLQRIAKFLAEKYGKEPSLLQVAKEMGVSPKLAQDLDSLGKIRKLSIHDPVNSQVEGGMLLEECLTQQTFQSPDAEIERQEVMERIQEAIAKLPPREQVIFSLRVLGSTFQQIGNRLHISQERARQLYYTSRNRLRSHLMEFWKSLKSRLPAK